MIPTKNALLRLALATSLVSAQLPAQEATPEPASSTPAPAPGSAAVTPLSDSLSGEAKAEYESGKILYVDGDHAGAALKFQRAFELSGDARLLWNRAAAEKNLRHYAQVRTLVRQYLATGGPLVSAEERADAEELIALVEAFVSEVSIRVDRAGAAVSVDGRLLGVSPLPTRIPLDLGEHTFSASKPGFQPQTIRTMVEGGKALVVDLQLLPEVREGTLRVFAGRGSWIRVDGRRVGADGWQGRLAPGSHTVQVDAPGKLPYSSDALVQDGQVTVLHVTLQDVPPPAPIVRTERGGGAAWAWIGAGVVLVGGAIAGYFLLRPEPQGPPEAVEGTLGKVPLGVHF